MVCCAGLSVAVPGGPAPPASNYITQFNQKGGAYHQGRAVARRERWLIVSLVTVQGLSYAEVARRLMLSNAGVRKIVLRFMALRQVLRLLTSSLRRHGWQDLTRARGTERRATATAIQATSSFLSFDSEARTKKRRERGGPQLILVFLFWSYSGPKLQLSHSVSGPTNVTTFGKIKSRRSCER